MIDTTFLDQLDTFSLIVKKRITSTFTGKRKSPISGRGTIIKDKRMYVPGDDFRLIDWKVYARTDKLHVRVYEEDKSLTTHVLLDASASMNFGKLKKFDYAAMLALGFSYIALNENEKFQIATFSDVLVPFHPHKGVGQLASMITYLNEVTTRGKTDFLESIRRYKTRITSRSLIILISDFFVDPQEVKDAILYLGDHEIKVVQVLDPVEKNLSLAGDIEFKDLETTERLRTFVNPKLREEYQKRLIAHNAAVEKACDDLGVPFYTFTTDTPVFDAFYLMIR